MLTFPAIDNEPVKNSYNLDKQLIITGPNAAGKTTLLKTTLFNVLLYTADRVWVSINQHRWLHMISYTVI